MATNGSTTLTPQTSYAPKNYEGLIGMPGFSEKLLRTHFKLYEGYVKNSNLLLEKELDLVKKGNQASPEFAELNRRFGFEFNGMRLHEYYFDNLGGKSKLDESGSAFARAVAQNYGDFETWKKDFVGIGSMRGVGWAVTYQDSATGRLINTWINEHHVNHFAGCQPVLVMDVWEHAFMTDYGTDRPKYIEAFFANINWSVVEPRLKS